MPARVGACGGRGRVYGERAAIAVMGPARADGPKGGRAADLAGALGHHLARAGYAVVVEGHGLAAMAVARAARQGDAPVVAVDAPDSDGAWKGVAGIHVEHGDGVFGA